MGLKIIQFVSSTVLLFSLMTPVVSSASPQETRSALKEWIRIESEISREKADWSAEKEIISDQIELLDREKERLEATIEEARSGIGEMDSKRMAINEEREDLKAVMASLEGPLADFEATIRELYKSFPEPLQEETSRLYERIPEDPEKTRLTVAERLQAVVGLLNFADKFNSGVQREVEIRTMGNQKVEVETLYFGLAGAYYSDSQGRHAGVGVPTSTGWEWRETPDAAEAIARLIGVYNGTREAEFSNVPASIQ